MTSLQGKEFGHVVPVMIHYLAVSIPHKDMIGVRNQTVAEVFVNRQAWDNGAWATQLALKQFLEWISPCFQRLSVCPVRVRERRGFKYKDYQQKKIRITLTSDSSDSEPVTVIETHCLSLSRCYHTRISLSLSARNLSWNPHVLSRVNPKM